MSIVQVFCSVADLVEDQQSAGASEARWLESIKAASDFLQKEIGWFIPVTQTLKFDGNGRDTLYVSPLLRVNSIINDETTLTSADYLPHPDNRHWANGPYSWLTVAADSDNLSEWFDEDGGVVLDGVWGFFDKTILTGATVASNQAIDALTLAVSDGGKVSPGMILLIGTEQMLVNGWESPTAAVTKLNGAVSASDVIFTLDDATLVKRGEILRVEFEQVKVKDVQGNRISVTRGWNGSGTSSHADNSDVDVYRTVSVERGINGTTSAAHASSDAISRYVVPDDILFLTREIATLMLNKAKGGYQGKSGSAETGVVFYNDAFPRDDLERIKQVYFLPD